MADPDDRLTSADIEEQYGVRQATVWQWVRRGKLTPAGRALGRGAPWLYRRADVEAHVWPGHADVSG